MDCEYKPTCGWPADVKLLFTSGMSGRYCEKHAALFDEDIIVDRSPISVKTWKFAVNTRRGIYFGSVDGEPENNDTPESQMKMVAELARQAVAMHDQGEVLGCFVSDGNLFVDPTVAAMQIDLNFQVHVHPPTDLNKWDFKAGWFDPTV